MYRMLITDDNSDAREVIEFLVGKYNFPLETKQASNGKEALAKLKEFKADILFTDVKMPFMDGMELATKARELYPQIQIIFFSAYDDFSYIKKALSLQAVDYLLKPVNPEEFQKIIAKVIESKMELEQGQKQQEDYMHHMMDHILYRCMTKTSKKKLQADYPTTDLGFLEEYQRLFIVQFENPFFDQEHTFEVDLGQVIHDEFQYLNLNPSQGVLLFKGKKKKTSYYMELAKSLRNYIENHYSQIPYIAISAEIESSQGLSKAYEEAERYLEDRFFLSNTFIFSGDTSYDNEKGTMQDTYLIEAVKKDLEYKDAFNLQADVDKFFNRLLDKDNKALSHFYIRYVCCGLLESLYNALPDGRKGEFELHMVNIYSIQKLDEIEVLIKKVLREVLDMMKGQQEAPNHAIHVVKKYIMEHYKENLSLSLLAEKVYLSTRYLSAMFIQETGCGLNKYIKNVRMDEAKKLLLNSNMKVADICQQVGYSNVSYFCKSFKDSFGMTPDKYRESAHK